jgi:hypothetical protein
MYISLSASYPGYACGIKESIDNYHTKGETQFFDWLVCSMKSVNELIEGKPILFEETYEYYEFKNSTTINFKYFDLLTSNHDIQKFNENSIKEITEKYKKRYQRFIKTLKEEKKIFFLRYCKNQSNIEEEQINRFYKNIRMINNKLSFAFILISDDDNLILPDSLKNKKNLIYINLKNNPNYNANEYNEYCKTIENYKYIYETINFYSNSRN